MLHLHTLTYAFLAYAALTFLLNLWYFRRRRPPPALPAGEKISVLVPARNEQANLSRCLDSLLAQSQPELEILVMDDDSTDGTWALLQGYAGRHPGRIRAFRNRDLPAGWTGKCWVCSRLAELAAGGWLAFVDADTVLHPDCIRHALREARRRGAALVSYVPDMVLGGLAEKIGVPVITFAFYLMFPMGLVRWLRSRQAAMAVGTFLLVRRGAYERCGGHAALRRDIVEDVSLARALKAAGEPVELLDGTGLLYTRFYHNAREVWNGFSKAAFGAFGFSFLPYAVTLVFVYALFLNPFLMLALHPTLSFYNPFFNQVLAVLALRLLLALRVRQPLLTALLHPVMVVFGLLFCLNSLWRIAWGLPIEWKQRQYRISR
jgi:chlorobactene glucosyltransferase